MSYGCGCRGSDGKVPWSRARRLGCCWPYGSASGPFSGDAPFPVLRLDLGSGGRRWLFLFATRKVLFNRQGARPTQLRDSDGLWHEGLEAMDSVLWRSREPIWASCPASPEHAAPVLDAYFAGRQALFPEVPRPKMGEMLRIVLAPAGSAPGVDNEPYELYHIGAHFVASLLGQALLTMSIGDEALTYAAGPAVDLLLWIPKKAAAEGASDMRRLQLPPCFRRLVVAALAGIVGPIVEPHVSPRQVAIRGGYCGPNVAASFRHLAGLGDDVDPGSHEAWDGLLGDIGPPLWDFAGGFDDPLLADVPAVVFEDQSKAFERMPHAWLVEVLRRWRMPRWLIRGLLDQVFRRAVRAGLRGRLGEMRVLLRGIGMGGGGRHHPYLEHGL